MTNKIDALIAPRALTAMEMAQVLAPHLIVYGVAHRAFIHAETLQDDTRLEVAVVHASEAALAGIAEDAMKSISDWLSDMDGDHEPRFYRKASLRPAVSALLAEAGQAFARCDQPSEVGVLADRITDREAPVLQMIIDAATAP